MRFKSSRTLNASDHSVRMARRAVGASDSWVDSVRLSVERFPIIPESLLQTHCGSGRPQCVWRCRRARVGVLAHMVAGDLDLLPSFFAEDDGGCGIQSRGHLLRKSVSAKVVEASGIASSRPIRPSALSSRIRPSVPAGRPGDNEGVPPGANRDSGRSAVALSGARPSQVPCKLLSELAIATSSTRSIALVAIQSGPTESS